MARQPETSKYMNKNNRTVQILDVACQLFADKSYDTVSVREIADACECSPALILKLFVSKEAIYEALLNEWEEMCNEAWIKRVPDGDAITGLEYIFNLIISGNDERNHIYRPNLSKAVLSRVQYQDRHNKIMHKQQNIAKDIILPLIERGQRDGSIKQDNPEQLAELVWYVIYGTRLISSSYPKVNKVKFSLIKELIL